MNSAKPEDSPVQALLGLIDYQSGSIVSRQILKKKTGNVTLFAFSMGEGLSEHAAPFDAWIYVPEGMAEVQVGEDRHEVSTGETILLPANVPHAVQARSEFKMLLVMIRD